LQAGKADGAKSNSGERTDSAVLLVVHTFNSSGVEGFFIAKQLDSKWSQSAKAKGELCAANAGCLVNFRFTK
jgi:hypothetical protein